MVNDEQVDRVSDVIGYHMAAIVSGNNMPDMSGDPRRRIPDAKRRNFDDACRSAAVAALEAIQLPEHPAVKPLEWVSTSHDDGSVFWSGYVAQSIFGEIRASSPEEGQADYERRILSALV